MDDAQKGRVHLMVDQSRIVLCLHRALMLLLVLHPFKLLQDFLGTVFHVDGMRLTTEVDLALHLQLQVSVMLNQCVLILLIDLQIVVLIT